MKKINLKIKIAVVICALCAFINTGLVWKLSFERDNLQGSLDEANKTIKKLEKTNTNLSDDILTYKDEVERLAQEAGELKSVLEATQNELEAEKEKNKTANTSADMSSNSSRKAISLPSGNHLTKSSGVYNGPSGKETYYNLDMSGVVSIMRGIGNNDEYWVRSDGVKMLGDYVMVAADFSTRPRGSLIETSLGTGIVCDTGTFVYNDPTQLDIAVTW